MLSYFHVLQNEKNVEFTKPFHISLQLHRIYPQLLNKPSMT